VEVANLLGIVENYILVLLYSVIAQSIGSPIFSKTQVRYLSVVHEQHEQFNTQQGDIMTEEEKKTPIRVTMKVGDMEFNIEGTTDQIKDALENILPTITEFLKDGALASERASITARAETCKGLIQKLWSEGWFAAPRGLGDVHSEMARRGFHYDRTAVAHALVDLVKEGVLTREGRPRRYRYAQKRPPGR
jgi:hypothetical protein